MSTPEARARALIDRQLEAAGWVLQHRDEFNRTAARGVAVREFPLPAGEADYLLFVDGRAAGVVEAKPEGQTLTGVAEQSEKYMHALPPAPAGFRPEPSIRLREHGHRNPVSRRARSAPSLAPRVRIPPPGNAARMGDCPRHVCVAGSRPCRRSIRAGFANARSTPSPAPPRSPAWRRRSLAATRARSSRWRRAPGKTYLACTFIYRLIKYAGARRVLFLVDRNNLGDQTLREFQHYVPPDDPRRFTALYVVQHLKTNTDRQGRQGRHHHDPAALRHAPRRGAGGRGRGALGVRKRRRRPAQGGDLHAARSDRDLRLHRHR